MSSSPRLEPRESNLPWTLCHCRAVPLGRKGHAGDADAVVCSRGVDSGFSRAIPGAATVASPAVRRHGAGDAGGRSRSTGPAAMAVTAANSKHIAIGNAARAVCGQHPDRRQFLPGPPPRRAQLRSTGTASTQPARVSACSKKAQKFRFVPAIGQAATCSFRPGRPATRGVFVVPCAARRCGACSNGKGVGGDGAAAVCSGRAGGRGGGHAVRNDVFRSGRRAAPKLISLGLL